MNQEIEILIRALYQTVGNKRYMTDVERMLRALGGAGLQPNEKQALRFLASDLNQHVNESNRNRRGY